MTREKKPERKRKTQKIRLKGGVKRREVRVRVVHVGNFFLLFISTDFVDLVDMTVVMRYDTCFS